MRQVWSDLLFLHWEVPESSLRALIPAELDVDTFEGRAYVGLVPFAMSGVRPVFLPPVPGLSRFLEVNVRTYVRCRADQQRGVWFFSLDAAHRVAVALGRSLWSLPYHFARMRMERVPGGEGSEPEIRYTSERVGAAPGEARCELAYTPRDAAREAEPGTLEHFLVERYLLYVTRRSSLYRGRVVHPPYRIQEAELHDLQESLVQAVGLLRPDEPPLTHYVRGVDVRIHPIRRVPT